MAPEPGSKLSYRGYIGITYRVPIQLVLGFTLRVLAKPHMSQDSDRGLLSAIRLPGGMI